MKKLLSIFLVIALLVSLVSVCALAADENVALGKPYETSGLYRASDDADPSYPDTDNKELTDGVIAPEDAGYGNEAFMGFNVNYNYEELGYSWVRVDLKDTYSVSKFVLHVGNDAPAGITPPSKVTFLVSTDGKDYKEVGVVEPGSNVEISLSLDKAVDARYVEVRSVHATNWMFISELEVFAPASSGSSTPSDQPSTPSKVTKDLFTEALEWVPAEGGGYSCTHTYENGKLTVSSEGGWPHVLATLPDGGVVLSPDDEIAVDFELVSGRLNFTLVFEVNGAEHWVFVQHSIAMDKVDAASGDLNDAGKYNASFKIKDAIGNSTDYAPVESCSKIPEAESYTLKQIRVCPVGGTVVVNSLAVVSDAPATNKPAENNPGTGDSTMVFALIALVAMGGAVVVTKKAR